MALAKMRRRYTVVRPIEIRPVGRSRAWELSAADVVACCYASRGVAIGERRTRRSMDAAGAAILILRDRGYSFPEIQRALGWPAHSVVMSALRGFTARLHAEDRAAADTITDAARHGASPGSTG